MAPPTSEISQVLEVSGIYLEPRGLTVTKVSLNELFDKLAVRYHDLAGIYRTLRPRARLLLLYILGLPSSRCGRPQAPMLHCALGVTSLTLELIVI